MWQIATASASATSCGDGAASRPEEQLHHLPDLMFLGAAESDDRALDLGRRVLDDRMPRLGRRQQRDAARVPELQRAANVPGVEDVLDGDAVGTVLGEERGETGVDGRAGDRETR